MADDKQKVSTANLKDRSDAELQSLLASKQEDLRKVRFKHALNQLASTHVLRELRRDIARLNTALTGRKTTTDSGVTA